MTKVSSDYERIAQILNLLGNTDSLKILNHAVKGFKSGKTTIKELEVTPRKYYRNLKTLIDLDLVRMYDDCYALTSLGRVLHRLLFSSLAGFFNTNVNSADYLEEVSKTKEMTIIDNYNDLIKFLVHKIDTSNTEILLATKFIDFSVLQSVFNALERVVKVKTLNDSKLDYPRFFKLIEEIHRDIRSSFAKFFVDADKNYRLMNVPFSFIVVDGELTVFEVPSRQFKVAFVSTDPQIVKALTELFWELWHDSKTLNVPGW